MKVEAEELGTLRGVLLENCPVKTWLMFEGSSWEQGPWFMRLMNDDCAQGGTVLTATAEGRVGTVLCERLRDRVFQVLPPGKALRFVNT